MVVQDFNFKVNATIKAEYQIMRDVTDCGNKQYHNIIKLAFRCKKQIRTTNP